MLFNRDLTFRDAVEPCAVCMEVGRELVFPAREHAFCVRCSRSILWGIHPRTCRMPPELVKAGRQCATHGAGDCCPGPS